MKLTATEQQELQRKRAVRKRKVAASQPGPATIAEATDEQLAAMTPTALAALPDVERNASTIARRLDRDGMSPRAAATAPLRNGGNVLHQKRRKNPWKHTCL